jgi:hypothetical protein
MRLPWASSIVPLLWATVVAGTSSAAPQLVGDGRADNTAAFGEIFASTTATTVHLRAGTYRISCREYAASSAVSLEGAGRNATVIRLPPGCRLPSDLFSWTNFANVKVQNLTIDLNKPQNGNASSALAFYTNISNTQGLIVSDVGIVNDMAPGFGIRITVNIAGTYPGTGSWVAPKIDHNYIMYSSASPLQNQCIALGGTGVGDSVSLGFIHKATISSNTCVNSAMQIDGDHGTISNNAIRGWLFGAGIFLMYDQHNPMSVYPTSDNNNTISGNVISDGSIGWDSNNTPTTGIESSCLNCIIDGNYIHDNGGVGILQYGNNATISRNRIENNAKTKERTQDYAKWGNYIRSGIVLAASSIGEPYHARAIVILGNDISSSSTQAYAYADTADIDGPVTFKGNVMKGAVAKLNQRSARGLLQGDIGVGP